MDFYLIVNGEQQGPFTIDELAKKGITPESEVWAEGMADWKQAGDVPELTEVLQKLQFNQHQAQQREATPVGEPYDPTTSRQQTPPPVPPQRAAQQQPYNPQPKRGSGCTPWLLALLIMVILFAVMVFTCPSQRDHERAIQQVTQAFVNDKVEQKSPLDENSIFGRMLNELIKNVTGYGTDMAVTHYLDVKNYLVCSVGKMTVGDMKDKTVSLGLFGHVFTFDKEDLEKAWAQAMDKYEDDNRGILPPPVTQQDEEDQQDEGMPQDEDSNDPTMAAPDPTLPDSILGVAVPQEMDSLARQMASEAINMAKEWAKKQIDEFGK